MRHLFKLEQVAASIYEQESLKTDLVVGVSEEYVNIAIEKVYRALYPALFKDQLNLPNNNYCFLWDVTAVPYLTFANSKTAKADFIDFYKQAHEQLKADYPHHEYEENDFSESSAPIAIEMCLPVVRFTLLKIGQPNHDTSVRLKITLSCYLSIDENSELSIIPYAGRVDNLQAMRDLVMEMAPELQDSASETAEDDLINMFIDKVLFPFVLKACNNLIPKVVIPKLAFGDIRVEQHSVKLQDKKLLIYTDLHIPSSEHSQSHLMLRNGHLYLGIGYDVIKEIYVKAFSIIREIVDDLRIRGKGYDDINFDVDLVAQSYGFENPRIYISGDFHGSGRLKADWGMTSFVVTALIKSKKYFYLYLLPAYAGKEIFMEYHHLEPLGFEVTIKQDGIIPSIASFAHSLFTKYFPAAIDDAIKSVVQKLKICELPELKFSASDIEVTADCRNRQFNMLPQIEAVADVDLKVKRKHKDRLQSNEMLKPGESLISANGQYMLNYTVKGDIETVNTANNALVWRAEHRQVEIDKADRLHLQKDGNLVAYDVKNRAYWATDTHRSDNPDYHVVLESDGNFVMYKGDGTLIWDNRRGKYSEAN